MSKPPSEKRSETDNFGGEEDPSLVGKDMNTNGNKMATADNVRNTFVQAMQGRYGNTTKVMKDRRTPRKGQRNKQRDYQDGNY